jgi:hypothetical protein
MICQISATVARINDTIKEKKNKLAPLIKELRNVRAEFATLEAEHAEKKALYEQVPYPYYVILYYIISYYITLYYIISYNV